eukprot:2211769-Prymnesium_polylepis.1
MSPVWTSTAACLTRDGMGGSSDTMLAPRDPCRSIVPPARCSGAAAGASPNTAMRCCTRGRESY